MKKLLVIIFATALVFATSSITNFAQAQTEGSVQEGDFKAGIGLAFGSGVGFRDLDNDLGIRADGYYAVTPEIRIGGDFTFYFPKEEEVEREEFGDFFLIATRKLTVWELNLNGNYIFLDEDGLIVYALAGINITGLSISSDLDTNVPGDPQDFLLSDRSDSELGLNLGGGVEYDLDFADLFAEVKLGGLGGNADQFVLGAGLRFSF